MADAVLYNGNPLYMDYTNTTGSDITAGTVVTDFNDPEVGEGFCAVAHVDIAAGEKAALAAMGAIYMCTVDQAFVGINLTGIPAYWDKTNSLMGTAFVGRVLFGYFAFLDGGAAAGQPYPVVLNPSHAAAIT